MGVTYDCVWPRQCGKGDGVSLVILWHCPSSRLELVFCFFVSGFVSLNEPLAMGLSMVSTTT